MHYTENEKALLRVLAKAATAGHGKVPESEALLVSGLSRDAFDKAINVLKTAGVVTDVKPRPEGPDRPRNDKSILFSSSCVQIVRELDAASKPTFSHASASAADAPRQAKEMKEVAATLRNVSSESGADTYLTYLANTYFGKALQLGAFRDTKWTRFKIDAERWFEQGVPLASAAEWFLANGKSVSLNVDTNKGNADLKYWTQFIADLIQQDAEAIEAEHRATIIAAAAAVQPPDIVEQIKRRAYAHPVVAWIIIIALVLAFALPALNALVQLIDRFNQQPAHRAIPGRP